MPTREIANERFKRRSRASFWPSLIAATLLHAIILAGSPVWAVAVPTGEDARTTLVKMPDVRIPEPPPPFQRPVAPVIATTDVDPLKTIPRNIPDPGGIALTPPAPDAKERTDGPRLTPMEVAPRLLNPSEVRRALRRHYPPALRDAGIGGEVLVWFHIDAEGRVLRTQLQRSSGFDAMDAAALAVADLMQFSPAYNRDRRVPVWVALPIRFETQR